MNDRDTHTEAFIDKLHRLYILLLWFSALIWIGLAFSHGAIAYLAPVLWIFVLGLAAVAILEMGKFTLADEVRGLAILFALWVLGNAVASAVFVFRPFG